MTRIIYMGTPDFAVPCLEALIQNGYEIPCVVTQPDKPVGRKQILTGSPVKITAEKSGLSVYQPQNLRMPEVFEYLRSLAPDFIVVAAYGKILPKAILDLPRLGCVNVHGSLLPSYRGAAPIQRAVIQGESYTGLTTMLMNEGVDSGDILLTAKTEIKQDETAGELFNRLAAMGPELLLKTLDGLSSGKISPIKQDESKASYAPMLSKEEAEIDWNQSCDAVYNQIRGMNPWPIAYTFHNGKKIKIYSAEKTEISSLLPNGTLYQENGQIFAKSADGVLHISLLQVEGSRKMSDMEYLNGHQI